MNSDFELELKKWGPQAEGSVSPEAARAYCMRLATGHYENFPVVSWMLPRNLRPHFYAVYAYCRWADDLADEVGDPRRAIELLGWWRSELNDCYAGSVRHPVFVALRPTIEQFDIPQQPFDDLISAFEQDQRTTEYETFEQLSDYCRRSANPVGRIVLRLLSQYSEENVRLSDLVCTGLQLANFWQDVGRDLGIGRVYLPEEDCRTFGYEMADLRARVTNDAFLELMKFQVDRARDHLQAGLPLAAQVPGRLQMDIELFIRGGLTILNRIAGIGYRVWEQRPVVTKRDVVMLFLGCTGRMAARRLGIRGRAHAGPHVSSNTSGTVK